MILTYATVVFISGCSGDKKDNLMIDTKNETINEKASQLLSKMTIEEKVGQMNQYNGFWDVTGPVPENGNAKKNTII